MWIDFFFQHSLTRWIFAIAAQQRVSDLPVSTRLERTESLGYLLRNSKTEKDSSGDTGRHRTMWGFGGIILRCIVNGIKSTGCEFSTKGERTAPHCMRRTIRKARICKIARSVIANLKPNLMMSEVACYCFMSFSKIMMGDWTKGFLLSWCILWSVLPAYAWT